MLLSLPGDRVDAQHGQRLAVAVLAAVVVAALLLEDDDLLAALLRDDGGADRGAGDERRARRRLGALADHQDVAERDRRAGLAGELLDGDHVVLGDSVLLSAGADHCIHGARLHAEALPDGTPRPGNAHYSRGFFAVNSLADLITT